MRRINRFRDLKEEYDELDCVVLGVSADHETSHGKFIAKYSLNFSLLADTNRYINISAYNVRFDTSNIQNPPPPPPYAVMPLRTGF